MLIAGVIPLPAAASTTGSLWASVSKTNRPCGPCTISSTPGRSEWIAGETIPAGVRFTVISRTSGRVGGELIVNDLQVGPDSALTQTLSVLGVLR
jgi:hypothetical protein